MDSALDAWAANRKLFHVRVERALAGARAARSTLALLHIDLDRIGQVNHLLGRELADRVLSDAAVRIAQGIGPCAALGRLAADDFAALIEVQDLDGAKKIAAALLEHCRTPYLIDCITVTVTASIGIGLYPARARDATSLMESAQLALFRAKIAGRDCFYPGGATCCGGTALPPRRAHA